MTPTPAPDPARLLADLAAAKLLSADRGARLLAEFRRAGGHGPFLDHLLAAGVLTPFQAERVAAGQALSLLVGPYLLEELVGSGSLGAVYQAVHRGDRRRFAVKVLPLRSLWNVLQAKKQVHTLAALPPHPAVVPLADVDTAGPAHYLAWPFVEGETLESLVRRTGPLPPAHAARLLAQVADGLAVLHAHGLTHGLLKPANLLLGADGRPRLLDLGMGAILTDNLADGESMLDTISTANAAISSFDYAAPETIIDPTLRTPAGDVYSLGCVLHCLLTGSPPFPDGNAVDKMLAHQAVPPPPVRDKNPLVSDSLAGLADRLMAKKPEDRPTDLPAVRLALLAAADEKSSGSTTVASARRTPPADDPPPPAPDPEPEAEPLSVAISRLRGRLAEAGNRGDGAAGAVDLDLPDPDFPAGNLPGLIDTGPPALFNLPAPATTPPRSVLRTPPAVPPPAPRPQAPAAVPRFEPPPVLPPAAPKPSAVARLKLAVGRLADRLLPGLRPVPPDTVQVSVFGPRHLRPGKTVRLQVYAHPVEAFASVCTLSRALQPDSEVLAVGPVDRPVARGVEVGLHLAVRNAGLARSLTAFAWQGKPKAEPFELLVPWEGQAGPTPAALTVGLNNVQAGKVVFELTVLPRSG